MIDQLQRKLRELRDCRSSLSANQARLHDLKTAIDDQCGDADRVASARQRAAGHKMDMLDREIATVEKMLQEWLADRPAAAKDPR